MKQNGHGKMTHALDLIHEYLGKKVDIVISDGYGESIPSTIVNCTNNIAVVTRKGKGDTNLFL